MQIYLYQNEQQVGPYSAEDIQGMISNGQLAPTDLGWHEGLEEWQPLGALLPLPMAAPSPAPPSFVPVANAQGEVKTNVKQGAVIGGWVCFALGILLMFLSMWTFVIYVPLFLVSFILSIVAMSQRRILGGLALLLTTLVVPTILGVFLPWPSVSDMIEKQRSQHEAASTEAPPTAASTSTQAAPSSVAASTPQTGSKNTALDQKNGFRNFRLGSPFSQFESVGMSEGFASGDAKIFRVLDTSEKIGGAEISAIFLKFDEDTLVEVSVRVEGESNQLALKEALISAFGKTPAERGVMGGEVLSWEGADTTLMLSIGTDVMSSASATATYESKSVEQSVKKVKQDRAKAQAAQGAADL